MNLHEELEKVKARIKSLEYELKVEKRVLQRLKAIVAPVSNPQDSTDRPTMPGSITSQIETAISTTHQPMAISDIVSTIEESGGGTTAKSGLKAQVAAAISRRDDLFVRVNRGVYDLKNRNTD